MLIKFLYKFFLDYIVFSKLCFRKLLHIGIYKVIFIVEIK